MSNYVDRLYRCFSTVNPPSDFDRKVNIVARTLMGEAENQSAKGMGYVADTLHNRAVNRKTDVVTEALKSDQYSCWNALTPKERSNINNITYRPHGHAQKSPEPWNRAMNIASNLVNKVYSPTSKATHYHKVDMDKYPSWSSTMKDTFIEGAHKFGTTN